MDHRYKKKLENSWAGLFYKHVFCKISEGLFEPLYCSNNGRPNFPINILVALEIIKHLKNYTDEVLFDAFAYDFQISYAVGPVISANGISHAELSMNFEPGCTNTP